MRNGKYEFTENEKIPDESSSDFSFEPSESVYRATPASTHRPLTSRDEYYNRKVSELFNWTVPGLPIDADPPQIRPPTTPFSQIIEQTLKRLHVKASPFLDDLAAAWEQILPPEIARVTCPGKWDAGILYVYVTSSIHLFELRRTALPLIEQTIRAFAGEATLVKQVRLMVNAVPLPQKR